MENGFESMIRKKLSGFGDDLAFTPAAEYAEYYDYIENYSLERQLNNTAVALPVVYTLAIREESQKSELRHCLSVCRMLIGLHLQLSREEEDIMLASALCHILPEIIGLDDIDNVLCVKYGLDAEVSAIVRLLFLDNNSSQPQLMEYYRRIREAKLALLITLADRGNIVEQLYGISSWSARRYIYETRNYYLPMCIYAKEHYPELLGSVSILMEKMRNLIEVAEILLGRYEVRETELTQEILALQEENATLKGIISTMLEGENG